MSPEVEKAILPAIGALVMIWLLVSVWRSGTSMADQAYIQGFRDATSAVSFGVSQSYEHDGLRIPDDVEAAIVMMEKAEKRENMIAIKMGLWGSGRAFGDAMGKAAQLRGRELAAQEADTAKAARGSAR